MNRRIELLLVAIIIAATVGCSREEAQSPPPSLVVVLVVDQMCPYHLDGLQNAYTGGLRRILDEGAVFENTFHDHASTYTSTGHATIVTGTIPARHGIVANQWYDRKHDFAETYSARDTNVTLVSRPEVVGASPHHLLVETIGDRLKSRSSKCKVFSVAFKDYAAVMMGGRTPDAVYWYDANTGEFCSSTYYMQAYPRWVNEFNAARPADDYRETVWTKSKPDVRFDHSRTDEFVSEADGAHTTFPYRLDEAAEAGGLGYYEFLRRTPFGDELTLRFAAAVVENEALGGDEATDLLLVSCSAADLIGHRWGPYSQEAEDYYIRLDGYLENFFGRLDKAIGRDRYVVVLTSDHGVLPMPEYLAARGQDAGRIDTKRYAADVDSVADLVAGGLGIESNVLRLKSRGLVLNDSAAAEAGVTPAELRSRMAQRLKELPYIDDVYTYDELLAGAAASENEYFPLFVNGFHLDRGPDLHVVFQKFYILSGSGKGTTHGSCHDYDRHVPLVFMGSGVRAVRLTKTVATYDIAPTLARIMDVEMGEETSGRVLTEALVEGD